MSHTLGTPCGKAPAEAGKAPAETRYSRAIGPACSPMSIPREIELKLDVPVDSLRRLTSSSLIKGARKTMSKPSHAVSVYFDTDTRKLRRNGVSLRVRRMGGRHIQT